MAPTHTQMREISLGDLLPDEGVAEVQALYERGTFTARDLKPVLAKYEAILIEKGVLVDYLAYALEYMLGRQHSGKVN